jgi:galactokinase
VNQPASAGTARYFAERYGRDAAGTWFAPGRVNLLGGPDYNEVFVLPFALGAGVCAAASRRPDRRIALTSRQAGGEPVLLDIDTLEPGAAPGWAAYPAGVAWALGTGPPEVVCGLRDGASPWLLR